MDGARRVGVRNRGFKGAPTPIAPTPEDSGSAVIKAPTAIAANITRISILAARIAPCRRRVQNSGLRNLLHPSHATGGTRRRCGPEEPWRVAACLTRTLRHEPATRVTYMTAGGSKKTPGFFLWTW